MIPSSSAASSRAVSEYEPTLLAHHDRGAGVLAHRQYAAGGDIGVLHEIVGDETIVVCRFGIFENLGELFEVAGTQQMVDVDHRGFRQQADRFALDDEKLAAHRFFDAHAVRGQLAIGRRVGAVLEKAVRRFAHEMSPETPI